ncbi:unnamed protein product [Hymenolepis diminuta]|uniref:Uncharacterized protein n=1 Tax=Hymenolepis diminuta TaxID=6216 RepID=A0A564YFK8_HYMDI|nr:unnamed protein product [Hymenolepis diminuta]VUZ45314.1 unnamed protein product [Hymenolepis diminuta]
MYAFSDLKEFYLQLDEQRIYQVSFRAHLDSSVNDEVLNGDTTRLNIMRAKRQLVMLRPVLKSIVLSIKTQADLFGTLAEPVLFYSLFSINYRKVDDDKIKAVQNIAQGMKLNVCSMRQVSVKVLAGKVAQRNLATPLQNFRVNL